MIKYIYCTGTDFESLDAVGSAWHGSMSSTLGRSNTKFSAGIVELAQAELLEFLKC
jgi:hypothetical protein